MKTKITKTQRIIADVVLLLLVIALWVLYMVRNGGETRTTMLQTVVVEDGVCKNIPIENDIAVMRSGQYVINAKWWSEEEPGVVSALIITNEKGEQIFGCTGNKVDIVSTKMKLAAGKYNMKFYFLGSEEETDKFASEHDLGPVKGERFQGYGKDGQWTVNYSVKIQHPTKQIVFVCMMFGLAIGMVMARIMVLATKKGPKTTAQYDERQIVVRGTAYKYGFFTALFFSIIIALLEFAEIEVPAQTGILIVIGTVLSIFVMVAYNIWYDGYFALNENRKALIILFAIIGFINIIIGINNVSLGNVIRDGKLAMGSLNFICAIFMYMVLAVIGLKSLVEKREDAE